MKTIFRNIAYPLTIIGITVIACVFYWAALLDTQKVEMEVVRHQGELHVQQISEAVDQEMDATLRSVDTALRHLRSVYLHNRKKFESSVQDVLAEYPKEMVGYIIVIGADGFLAYSSGDKPDAMPKHLFFGDREHFLVHSGGNEDRLFISKPIIGRLSGIQLVQVTRPIRDVKRFVGVICFPLRPDYISKSLWSLHIAQNDMISILRDDGRFIARSRDLNATLNLKMPEDRPFMHTQPGDHGIFRNYSVINKIPMLFSWRHSAFWPVIVVTGIDEVGELAGVAGRQNLTRIRTLQAMALVLAFAFWISALILKGNKNNLAIKQENEKNLAFLHNASDGIHILDTNGNVIEASESFCAMLGYRYKEIIGMNVSQWDAGFSDSTELQTAVHKQFNSTERAQFETRHKRKDGTIFEVEVSGMPLVLRGKPVLFNSSRDITERKSAESELRIAATAFESQEGMAVTDANGTFLRVNQAFTDITGYTTEDVTGKTPKLLNSGRHDAKFFAAMWESINNTGAWEGEIWNRRKSGEVYPEHLTITAVKNAEGIVTNYVSTLTDITLTKAAEDEIKHLAFYDPLTRLPNRRLLRDRLRQALASIMRSGRTGALLFIDLDNFKILNDTLGHDIGDLLLQQVATRLESCVREGDTVARLGGDEFVIMLEDLNKGSIEAAEQTEFVGNKILATLNQPYQLASYEYHNTPSIGATLFSDNSQSIDDLMKQADIAMYQSKKAGRNTLHFFDPKMQETIDNRATIERELRDALEKQQFQLYYQLQVDGIQADGTHRPLGAEVLIRWNHPVQGVISPAKFISLAEETGLILPIGQWVLDKACAQIKVWERDGVTSGFVLAVNVSSKQFSQSNFVSQVTEIVQRHAINPDRLKLELTESLLLNDIEGTIEIMNELNSLGIQFSLDDFGTGYSSLQYLKRLPLDQIKIDQSFVRDIVFDLNDRAIVKTIIGMARSLNLNYIAEGVETEEQMQLLFEMGCSHYQGYLYGEPMPIEQFEEYLNNSISIR